MKKNIVWIVVGAVLALIGTGVLLSQNNIIPFDKFASLVSRTPAVSFPVVTEFGKSVVYAEPDINLDPGVAQPFSTSEIKNIQDMESDYGFHFSPAELSMLSKNKFVLKAITDTSIQPSSGGDNVREFPQLYEQIKGPNDYKGRKASNAEFFSTDVFLNAYGNLYTELLKEMENKTFFPSMKSLSKTMYEDAGKHLAKARKDSDRKKWTDVRNYFVVPYAIFANSAEPLTKGDYMGENNTPLDPEAVMSEWKEKDAKVDTYDSNAAFIKNLHLDSESESMVLADIKQIFDASGKGAPKIFESAYNAYMDQTGVQFSIDFSQFTPRATYTSSSLRREYFRGLKWYLMVPLFLKSPELTTDAYAISQLLAENPKATHDYDQLEAAITFMIGGGDDLGPTDYLAALAAGKDAPNKEAAAMEYLVKAHSPKIKDVAASYQSAGTEKTDDVRLATKGMRFISGKFIIDSYWTGYLTQGDEAVRPGYTQKLPPMASMLEVMTLLGSDYAKSQIPKLDFYSASTSKAIDQAIGDLEKENVALTEKDWQKNLYTSWLWVIKSLFDWEKAHHNALPQFMQSPLWAAKTLQTAAASWTELRHATVLYAKQSFAEMGGGGGGCDPREVPPPPKAYIEPNISTYARLSYLAKRTDQGLKEQGYELDNLYSLEKYIALLDTVQDFVKKELGNAVLHEEIKTTSEPDPDMPGKVCTHHDIVGESDWETLRLNIILGLQASIPVPVEGPVLPVKDRRVALITDVHTGGDSSYAPHILYEGEGVPYVIFTAVKDANGPRLTIGFVSSQYEFTKEYGGKRMTDEEWQKNFYIDDDMYNAYQYTPKETWPKVNPWFVPLFGAK